MSKVGHNSVAAGPVSVGRVKSFVERVEKLEEERKAIGGDIRDVYAEAKGVGYDVKTLRWAVQERRIDSADRAERDSLREVYAHALGMAVEAVRNGMTYREAEEEFGFSKSAIHRASHQPRDDVSGTHHRVMLADDIGQWLPPHDPETGVLPREMREADLGDYALIKPRVRVERPKKPEEDFGAKLRSMIDAAGLKIRPTEPIPVIDENDPLTIPDPLLRYPSIGGGMGEGDSLTPRDEPHVTPSKQE